MKRLVVAVTLLAAAVSLAQNASGPTDPGQPGDFGALTSVGPNTLGGTTTLSGYTAGQDAGLHNMTLSGDLTVTGYTAGRDGGYHNLTVSGDVTSAVSVNAGLSVHSDSLQTLGGGGTAMDIATSGSGSVTLGNPTSTQLVLSGGSAQFTAPSFIANGATSLAFASGCYLDIAGGSSSTQTTVASQGTDCGLTLSSLSAGATNLGTEGAGATLIGNGSGYVTINGDAGVAGALLFTGVLATSNNGVAGSIATDGSGNGSTAVPTNSICICSPTSAPVNVCNRSGPTLNVQAGAANDSVQFFCIVKL